MRPYPVRLLFLFLPFMIIAVSCIKTSSLINNNNNGNDSTDNNPPPAVTSVGTPIGDPASKTIGASGGTLTSTDGRVQLTIPAGALSNDVNIGIQAVTDECPGGIGVSYDLLPNGTKFAIPASIKFNYADSDVNGTDPYLLYLAFQDSLNEWELYDLDKEVDTVGKTVSFDINHFTIVTMDPYIRISPFKRDLYEGESTQLTIYRFVNTISSGGGKINAGTGVSPSQLSKWSLGGAGSIQGSGNTITYTAPSTIDKDDEVYISVVVQESKTVRIGKGKVITFTNKTYGTYLNLHPSKITFDVRLQFKFVGLSDVYQDTYTDGASLTVETNKKDNTVKVTIESNDPPSDVPASGSGAGQTATWVPDQIGLINVVQGRGLFAADGSVTVQLTSLGTVTPKYSVHSDVLGDYITGGDPVPGQPTGFFFQNVKGAPQVFDPIGNGTITATITARP